MEQTYGVAISILQSITIAKQCDESASTGCWWRTLHKNTIQDILLYLLAYEPNFVANLEKAIFWIILIGLPLIAE